MNGKVAVLLLVLGLSFAAAQDSKPAFWHGKGKWYGPVRPWNPVKPYPIWTPLQLVEVTTVTSIPAPGLAVAAGEAAVFWATVSCPANSGAPNAVVGSCSWTGMYLEAAAAGAVGTVDWNVVCAITTPCGGYGVGSITAAGRGEGTNGVAPIEVAITGGTGAYAGLNKGVIDARTILGGGYTYTFRFIR